MPLSPLSTAEEFIFRVKELKKNPKTYRVYSYSAKTAGKVTLETFGNRIYFGNLPTTIRLRFNEPENDVINIPVAFGIHQDFYRVYLEWDATGTDEIIYFIAGFDFSVVDLTAVFGLVKDLFYTATPLTIAENSKIFGSFVTGQASALLLDYKSDIAGTINVYSSFDGVTYYGKKSYAVGAGVAGSQDISVENKFAQVEFVKAVAGTPQAVWYLSVRSR